MPRPIIAKIQINTRTYTFAHILLVAVTCYSELNLWWHNMVNDDFVVAHRKYRVVTDLCDKNKYIRLYDRHMARNSLDDGPFNYIEPRT